MAEQGKMKEDMLGSIRKEKLESRLPFWEKSRIRAWD